MISIIVLTPDPMLMLSFWTSLKHSTRSPIENYAINFHTMESMVTSFTG